METSSFAQRNDSVLVGPKDLLIDFSEVAETRTELG